LKLQLFKHKPGLFLKNIDPIVTVSVNRIFHIVNSSDVQSLNLLPGFFMIVFCTLMAKNDTLIPKNCTLPK